MANKDTDGECQSSPVIIKNSKSGVVVLIDQFYKRFVKSADSAGSAGKLDSAREEGPLADSNVKKKL